MMALVGAAREPTYPAEIVCVVSNRADAEGLQFARRNGIATQVIDHKAHPSRAAFDEALKQYLQSRRCDIVACAGFMRVLSPVMTSAWRGRMLNIHPSLLPAYPGLDTHARALADGATVVGCTVHLVTEDLDGGPIVAQAQVPVVLGDNDDSLAARVLKEEHRIYPLALADLARSVLGEKA